MAGSTTYTKAPYPTQPGASVPFNFGVWCGQTLGASAVTVWEMMVPWDCYCTGFDIGFTKTETNGVDAVQIVTNDDSNDIRAAADIDATAVLAAGTQDSATANEAYQIKTNDKILVKVSSTTDEGGFVYGCVYLKPVYS